MRHTSPLRVCALALLMLLMSWSAAAPDFMMEEAEAASGIDVRPINYDMSYSSSSDESNYRLLSSHDPSGSGFNRPASLYVVDGMVNTSSVIQITIQNSGSNPSGTFPMRLVVLHNEYTDFEILNTSLSVNSIAGGSTTTASYTWTPRYGGNHTMVATTLHTSDDNTGNDAYSSTLAIGQYYHKCDSQAQWTGLSQSSPGWRMDSDIILSGNSFHIGSGGVSSSHGPNWDKSLTSPTFDFSNAHPSPNTYAKVGFFYTGSGGSGDGVRMEFYDRGGNQWLNTVNNGYTFDGVVDGDLTDSVSWLIQSEWNSPGGSLRPGVVIPTQTLNSQTQFKFRFLSDGTDDGQGYWIEDIVIIYDEKAWPEEYQVGLSKSGVDGHARRGHWADHVVTVRNDGNFTDEYTPTLTGLPSDWSHQFVHMSGSTILPSMALEVKSGESLSFRIQIKPGPSASTGPQTATATISSNSHGPSVSSVSLNTIVDPDYIPKWTSVPSTHYCLPGNACEFSVNLSNLGDGSDTFALSSTPVVQWDNWTFEVSFNQPPTVTLAPQGFSQVLLAADIPPEALPGQTSSIELVATSQADPSVSDIIRVNLTASMVSDASVGVNPADVPSDGWWVEPGESLEIPFTIWNNATSQDTFSFSLDESGMRGWEATLPGMTTLVVRPGETSRILVTLTAPMNAQSGDPAPVLTPVASSQISGSAATVDSFSGIRVKMLHNLILRAIDTPVAVIPGEGNIAVFEIENDGNGPDHAVISIDGLPSTWSYIIEVEGTVLSGPISLSPSYEGLDIKQFQLIFTPPGGEDANFNVDITVTINSMEGDDLNVSDNSHVFGVMTERVTRPLMNFDAGNMFVRTDSTHVLGMTVRNDGNALDHALRIRIVADSMIPGISTTLSLGGQSVGLNDWLDTPLPPQVDLELAWILGVAIDVPVGTQVTFTITLEGSDDIYGNPQSVVKTIVLTVESHREVRFTHNILEQVMAPEKRSLFSVNITSHSSFTEELTLHASGGDSWGVVCNNQQSAQSEWLLVVPASNSPDGRSLQWDCELTAPPESIQVPLELTVTTADGESLWYSQPPISSREVPSDPGGFSWSLSSVGDNLPLLVAGIAMMFLIFVATMVIAINRNKKRIDEEYEDEEEEEVVEVTVPVARQQVARPVHVAPAQQPQQSSFTDDQFRAAGWSEDKISEYRRQEVAEADEAMKAHQQAMAQSSYAQQVHHQQFTPHQNEQHARVAQQVEQQGGLSAAFGSLGVSKSPTDEASSDDSAIDTGAAAALLGDTPSSEVESEGQLPKETTQTSDEPSSLAGSAIPQVNCAFCNSLLSQDDKWAECEMCGAFCHDHCKLGQQVCARCGTRIN